jgi:rubrerythrin
MSVCLYCNEKFCRKYNLERHLKGNRCRAFKEMTAFDVHERFHELLKQVEPSNQNQDVLDSNQAEIINPITKLDTSFIKIDKIKELILAYDSNKSHVNFVLSDFLKEILCNKNYPKNHVVKYVVKNPPTYSIVVETQDEVTNIMKDTRDTITILTKPIIELLDTKLKESMNLLKQDETFDYELYEDTIGDLHADLYKGNIQQALKSILRHDILNNTDMKWSRKKKF